MAAAKRYRHGRAEMEGALEELKALGLEAVIELLLDPAPQPRAKRREDAPPVPESRGALVSAITMALERIGYFAKVTDIMTVLSRNGRAGTDSRDVSKALWRMKGVKSPVVVQYDFGPGKGKLWGLIDWVNEVGDPIPSRMPDGEDF